MKKKTNVWQVKRSPDNKVRPIFYNDIKPVVDISQQNLLQKEYIVSLNGTAIALMTDLTERTAYLASVKASKYIGVQSDATAIQTKKELSQVEMENIYKINNF